MEDSFSMDWGAGQGMVQSIMPVMGSSGEQAADEVLLTHPLLISRSAARGRQGLETPDILCFIFQSCFGSSGSLIILYEF